MLIPTGPMDLEVFAFAMIPFLEKSSVALVFSHFLLRFVNIKVRCKKLVHETKVGRSLNREWSGKWSSATVSIGPKLCCLSDHHSQLLCQTRSTAISVIYSAGQLLTGGMYILNISISTSSDQRAMPWLYPWDRWHDTARCCVTWRRSDLHWQVLPSHKFDYLVDLSMKSMALKLEQSCLAW